MRLRDCRPSRRVRLYLFLIIAFGLCLRVVYFSQEIGGSHTFRQAMVANQIDSLKSEPYPGPKLGFLERYDQVYDYGVVFYDTPIYQYIAAKFSDLLGLSGVTAGRLLNLAVYAGISLVFYQIMMEIGLSVPVSLLTMLLFAVSPLAIQNIIGIYPDTLATLAAYASFYLLMQYERQRSIRTFLAALALGYVCTLIKSSVYVVFLVAYAWNLLWSERLRVFRRFDVVAFAVLIAASVGLFVLLRTYFNYGQVIEATDSNYNESLRLSWFLGTDAQRLDLSEWREIGSRFTFEYLFPAFMPFALVGLWRIFRGFLRKPDEPQRTLLGLVVGTLVMILLFFNVFFRHDYYALPLLPVYCALTSIGLFYAHSAFTAPFARRPKALAIFAAAAIFISLDYAYSLRLLNYRENEDSVLVGKSLQDLVPNEGYLFYFQFADYVNPEFLYYVRRRGVAADVANANNDYVGRIIKDHKWNPENTYLLALGMRDKPSTLETLKKRLDKYELREIGSAYNKSIVYKVLPKS
jgi:hypothetical protein